MRWVLIVVAVTGGFWQTWAGLARETDAGGLVGYVFAVPGLAVIAAGGISRRRSRELPIHDRQTDIIVAVITAGLAVAIKAFLIPRYVDKYQLLYLDVLAAWLFVVAAAIMLFGLRPVARFTAAWVVLLTMFPLPYRILVIGLGGSKVAAGLIALALGVASTAVAVARSARRALLGALSTLMIGATALLALNHFRPSAPLLLYQYLALITSAAVSALFLTVTVYREPPAASTRSRTPIAATDAWAQSRWSPSSPSRSPPLHHQQAQQPSPQYAPSTRAPRQCRFPQAGTASVRTTTPARSARGTMTGVRPLPPAGDGAGNLS